jgi:predicted amidohydrolase YtcJ
MGEESEPVHTILPSPGGGAWTWVPAYLARGTVSTIQEVGMRFLVLPAIAAVFFLSGCSSSSTSGVQADWIFTGGQVVTVDEDFSIQEAIAVRGGQILAVGSAEAIDSLRGPRTEVMDLAGRAVVPGLQDSHIHFLSLGHDITYEAELTFAMTAEEIVTEITDLEERLNPAPGDWLVGNRWDQYKYPEMVTRWMLDEVTPENPVRLNRVYRGVAVNTLVFEMMGIRDEDPGTWPAWWLEDPPDFTFEDRIFRAPRTLTIGGESREYLIPTGAFVGTRASRLVTVGPGAADPDVAFEMDVESVHLGALEMLSLGVTSIVDPSSRMGYGMKVYQEAVNRGLMAGLRIPAVYEGTFYTHSLDFMREHFDGIKVNNLGDSWLRWRGVKFYADGGAGTRSAWLSESFSGWEDFEGEPNPGIPVQRDNDAREAQYRVAALDYGWDLHTHTCGDMAMRQTVDLYMKLMDEIRAARPDADLRWSLIHAYLPLEPATRVLEDMAEYGIIASVNPVFNWQEGAAFLTNLGPERFARTKPFRSYVEAGVSLNSGSDYPVTSHDPWIGMYALMTRRSQADGQVYGPDETLDLEEALRSYTINGAYLTYEEDSRGSLEEGKVADLVVLDLDDIHRLEANPDLLFEMRDRILLTMSGGKVRFRRGE